MQVEEYLFEGQTVVRSELAEAILQVAAYLQWLWAVAQFGWPDLQSINQSTAGQDNHGNEPDNPSTCLIPSLQVAGHCIS